MSMLHYFSPFASSRPGNSKVYSGRKWLLGLLLLLALYGPAQAQSNFPEGFESATKGGYAVGTVTLPTGAWVLDDALLGTIANDKKVGTKSVRIVNVGTLTMGFDVSTGASTVSLQHARYGTDAVSTWELRQSTDGGTSFVTVGSPVTSTATLQTATFAVNQSGNVRFQVRKLSGGGARLNIDEFDVQPLSGTPPALTTGAVSGSPFCVTATSGTAISVPYTNPADLSAPFAVQLSSAQGVFAADLTQNLIGQGSSSPLAATLPAGTAAGTGYRVRVVHVSSATAGQPNGANLTVTTAPATNDVTVAPASAQSLVTTGTGAAITATPAAPSSFAWLYSTSSNGPFTTAIATATDASYTPRGADFGAAGTYYLVARATSTCGSVVGTSAPVTITVTAPTPSVTATPNPVPDFGSVPVNTPSAARSVALSGRNLGGDVTLTPPAGFQLRTGTTAFSCAALTLPVSGGSLTATVEVRFVPEAAQAYSGVITLTSPGAALLDGIAVSGTGVAPAYPPSLSTAAVSTVTSTTATAGGTILEDGGRSVTARGVVYALTEAPTTQDDFTQDGTGIGSFSSALTGLLPSTTYYVRAYATNAQGTSYGEQRNFTTAAVSLATEPTQGSTLTATAVTPTGVTLAISGGDGAKKLLLVTPGPALSFQPADGTTYLANTVFGQGDQPAPGVYVVGAAATASVTVTGLSASTEYTYTVFDYNDDNTSGAENYLLTPAGELTLSTPAPPAGLLLADNFDYPAGDRLTAHGWTAHSAPGTNAILVSTTGLSYSGYDADAASRPAAANTAASLAASGEDVSRTFPSQGAGTAVYASLLVSVNAVTTADYFFHLGPAPLSTTFRGRLYVRPAATAGKIQFGVAGSGTIQYAAAEYELKQTYLLTMRYVFGPSGTETHLYVNPGQAEPATADATSTEAASSAPANLGSVALRQSANTTQLLVDGLRVANSYSAARAFSAAPLPVTLTAFSARRTNVGVQLQWATAQELNARTYHVERSTDGRTFTRVAAQPAAGTTTQARRYAVLDASAPTRQLYYRLAQEDTDGTLHYSSVVSVAAGLGTPAAALTVAPNPADPARPVTLLLTGRAGQVLTLQLLDNAGRLHHTQALRPLTDAEQFPLTLPATLPAGTYVLRVTGAGSQPLHTRLVLVR
ncbi:hypothetical protein [Hymenobacter yonginensis]|uniref:Fibronectin type-III domain-containing protein n=1 Tax=Hymenobacter yonginensis TaxID=748197 RepID=A0ABY7PVW0_9BACT|nr:hypothetical protein [Hymenobacter yonginensis]WBO86810.1 hypothetical protein O9Z63_20210 [Hymenobacter yonginensis]